MTPWVLRLLVANLLVFVLTAAQPQLGSLLALWPRGFLFQPWGVLTYMFVHGGIGHLFFNMLGLFFFGPRLEMQLGGNSFLRLYLFSGLGGALFSFLFAFNAPVVGASGAVFGVLLGFAYYWPRERIYIWGILPIESRWLVGLLAAAALYSGIAGSNAGVAHFAHLGGFAAGYAYLKWRVRKRSSGWRPVPTKKAKASLSPLRSDDSGALRRWKSIRVDELHELNRDEVERLLAKASDQGVGTLTPDERAMLDRFATGH
ncbi:rhomboid family intramembrane serine protease [Gemmatimonadota bacterium]